MKKTLVALSTATLLFGGLIGCGVDTARDDARPGTYRTHDGALRGFETPDPADETPGDAGGTPGGADETPGDAGGTPDPVDETPGDAAGETPEGADETPGDAAGETPEGADETPDDAADETPGAEDDAAEDDATPEAPAAPGEDRPFPDVGLNNTHIADIRWARDNGIFTGFKDGTFGPNTNLTRAEASSIMRRLHDLLAADEAGAAD